MNLKIKLVALFAMISLHIGAQEKIKITENDYQNSSVEMADQFRAHGKIYVVVAVITVILSGLLFYVYATDRKLQKIENDLASNDEKVKH